MPGASRVADARQDKVWPGVNKGLGVVCHSQEGFGLQAMVNLHNGNLPKSHMFWISVEGSIYQFMPVTACPWTSGNRQANTMFWPVECEGDKHNPLTVKQVQAMIKLKKYYTEYTNMELIRNPKNMRNLYEHNEVATAWTPNAGPTLCPSNRYDKFFRVIYQEPEGIDVTPAQVKSMIEDAMKELEARIVVQEDARSKRRDLREVADGPYRNVVEPAWDALKALGLLRVGDSDDRG
jgi:hypothetical protein